MSEQEQQAPQVMVEPAAAFEELDVGGPLVGIVMGSKSDMAAMEAAEKELSDRGITLRGSGDVRSPRARQGRRVRARTLGCAGLRVIIAGAGLSAALPGVVAAHTRSAGDRGSARRAARRSPAASMRCCRSRRCRPVSRSRASGVDNARNAAVLAARILAA